MSADPNDTAGAAFAAGDQARAKATDKVSDLVAGAVEAPSDPDQRVMTLAVLKALAAVINGDEADLKYFILSALNRDVIHQADLRDIFDAMQALADRGDQVDAATVAQAVPTAKRDLLADIFTRPDDQAMTVINRQATTYISRLKGMSIRNKALALGAAYMADLEKADTADPVALVAGLQKSVNDLDKTKGLVQDAPSNADAIDSHLDELASREPGVPTGFKALDRIIKGLRPGLMVLSAPPGAGKTTFAWQIADQVAAGTKDRPGTPVLFFSYEMSRGELMNKTLARECNLDNGQIMEGMASRDNLKPGVDFIKNHGRLIHVVEGDFHLGVDEIRLMVQRETMKAGKAPVVIIDYLQVIQVKDPNLERREKVDLIVSELRRLTRDLAAPVIAISSIARADYASGGKLLSAFKESGGIEFTADVAITLEVPKDDAADNSLSSSSLAKDRAQRPIIANIVKNRRGRQWSIPFTYDMKFDRFTEEGSGDFLSYRATLGDSK